MDWRLLLVMLRLLPLDGVADWDRVALWQDVQTAAQQRKALRDRSAAYAEAVADPAAELAGALTVIESCPLGTIDGTAALRAVRRPRLDLALSRQGPAAAQARRDPGGADRVRQPGRPRCSVTLSPPRTSRSYCRTPPVGNWPLAVGLSESGAAGARDRPRAAALCGR